jgi:RNA polymerase sigma factor (sigma-70 family)
MNPQPVTPSVSSQPNAQQPRSAEAFCAVYAELVSRFAVIVAPDRDEANDIAQEALLKAVARLQQFDPTRGDMNGWLWKIVANEARDNVRRSIRRRLAGLRWAEATRANLRPNVIQRMDELLAVETALKRQSQRDRELLALRFGADLDVAEVAAALGLSVDSCGRALRRATDRLRQTLSDQSR